MEPVLIALDRIDVPEKYKRERTQELAREQHHLAQSIRAIGLRFPIHVKSANGRYTLIDGYRRLNAMKATKSDKISAFVVPESDKADPDVLRFQSNFHRENLKKMDEAHLIRTLIAEEGISKAEAAKMIGKQVSTIERYFDCLKVGHKWQNLVNSGTITLSDVQPVAALTPKGQRFLFDQIKKRGLPFTGNIIRSVTVTMDPVKHPNLFSNPKGVAAARISERMGHPVSMQKVEGVGRMKAVVGHRQRVLKQYEDEIAAAIPVVKKVLDTKDLCEVLPGRVLKSFREFAQEYLK